MFVRVHKLNGKLPVSKTGLLRSNRSGPAESKTETAPLFDFGFQRSGRWWLLLVIVYEELGSGPCHGEREVYRDAYAREDEAELYIVRHESPEEAESPGIGVIGDNTPNYEYHEGNAELPWFQAHYASFFWSLTTIPQ